jgi:hypothetical protein
LLGKYKGVKYLGYSLGDVGAHARQQLVIANGIAEAMEDGEGISLRLQMKQALWAWTAYGRPHAEWASAIWPLAAERDVKAGLERIQDRALVALLCDAATPGARPTRAFF